MPQIHLCFVWHMHQPFYKDLATGEYHLPWTRLHALKDYYGMVEILREFPSIHQTFNLAPSMALQIQEYAAGVASDPFLACAIKPAQDLTGAEQARMLRHFFQFSAPLIFRYERYGELYNAWQACGRDPRRARRVFSAGDLRDLQVLSQLAWFDEEYRAHDPETLALAAKERHYSLDDQALMAKKQLEILRRVLPVYKEFSLSGQIEISTTPFYHPILPLICDSNIAAVSHPDLPLPTRFRYPGDALHQLETARAFMLREFGKAPVGLWPSEGSVSDEALSLAAQAGFEWAASDNGVLAATLRRDAGPDVCYRPYRWSRDGREIDMLFRDHYLSDLIGFVYQKMQPHEAAAHFLHHVRANSHGALSGGSDVLVPVILDGENAWEHYSMNGRPFLRELYRAIAESPDMVALTVSEALRLHRPQPLDHIFPGSWIDANFNVWIGAQEDNQAWELLLRARLQYDESAPLVSEENRKLAYEELLIAEGSDWCWWYGPEHASENRAEFDQLYRAHLTNVYRALGLTPPDELSRSILLAESAVPQHDPPFGYIHPVIDGEVTSSSEWMDAGRHRIDARSGAMHGRPPLVRDLFYGSDGENFYIRLDFEIGAEFSGVQLRAGQRSIELLDNPLIDAKRNAVFEARAPLAALGVQRGDELQFQVSLTNHALPLEEIPRQGWIEFSTADPSES
jgi:alpha-amylase/alpha-mannosidase (GH57 family)